MYTRTHVHVVIYNIYTPPSSESTVVADGIGAPDPNPNRLVVGVPISLVTTSFRIPLCDAEGPAIIREHCKFYWALLLKGQKSGGQSRKNPVI